MEDEPDSRKRWVILEPNQEEGELAVLNPTIYSRRFEKGFPFLYRCRRVYQGKEYSTTDYGFLENPFKVVDSGNNLLFPDMDYDSRGCEDARVSDVDGEAHITYAGYDGEKARVCLAITDDFKKVRKKGVVGPQFTLEQAVELVGSGYYKEKWERILKQDEKDGKKSYLHDKDAVIERRNGKWLMWHRLEPGIQLAIADSLDDFTDKEYWVSHLQDLDNNVIMNPLEDWENEKVGLGIPIFVDDMYLGLYHGVSKKDNEFTYQGGFVRLCPKTFKLIGKSKQPLFIPDEQDVLDEGEVKKRIAFPTAGFRLGCDNDKLMIYSGAGDRNITAEMVSMKYIGPLIVPIDENLEKEVA